MCIATVRSDQHIAFLQKSIASGTIPKGLRTRVYPQLPQNNTDFSINWDECHMNFGIELTNILLEYWTNRKATCKEEARVRQIIKSLTSSDICQQWNLWVSPPPKKIYDLEKESLPPTPNNAKLLQGTLLLFIGISIKPCHKHLQSGKIHLGLTLLNITIFSILIT